MNKGVCCTRKFLPHISRLADSLLEEVLDSVCADMEGACNSLATQLFLLEFQTAASHGW